MSYQCRKACVHFLPYREAWPLHKLRDAKVGSNLISKLLRPEPRQDKDGVCLVRAHGEFGFVSKGRDKVRRLGLCCC
jgi:hypothetical protein